VWAGSDRPLRGHFELEPFQHIREIVRAAQVAGNRVTLREDERRIWKPADTMA
jgi:hypothetical protein